MHLEKGIGGGGGLGTSLPHKRRTLGSHTVQFYEEDAHLLRSVSEFLCRALERGGACVVIATAAHRQGIAQQLDSFGIDVGGETARDRYIALDAQQTLSEFMVNGGPDSKLFFKVIEPIILRAKSAIRRRTSSVAAFGEMVTLLWEQGNTQGSATLEHLWNELARRHTFALRCTYPIGQFASDSHSQLFQRICEEHSEVIPCESYMGLESESDRRKMVSSLQQKASATEAATERRDLEIEQRLHAEERLRRTEEFAKTVIENGVDCVKVLDLEGKLEYMSPSGLVALEISGEDQVTGRRWQDFWKEEDRPRAEVAIAAAAAGSVGSFQGEYATPTGTQKTWDVKITPARDPEGNVDRLIAVSRDITELRMAQSAAIHAEKLATAGRMAATIAHEINNPLEAVTNYLFLARTVQGLPENVQQYLDIADRELTRVAHIARQTLGFYRSATERWLSVHDLIQDALLIYERRIHNKEIEVEVSVDRKLQAYGKDGELRQVLLNLMANAIDACRSGGRIWFRAKKFSNGEQQGIRVTLADNGAGMPAEVQRRVFVPFFTTKPENGTGIGLWVTKCLIEQRGGYVHFRSRQGEKSGTVMTFFLPCPEHSCADLAAA